MATMLLSGPGWCDLQVNGFAGVDFNHPDLTPEQVHHALAAMRATGVTLCLPTVITSPLEQFARAAKTILSVRDPAIAGLHMEGPYINPADGPRGAHRRDATMPPLLGDFLRRQEAADGRIRLVTLAPELPGALRLTEALVSMGVRVAIGHSAATPGQIADAVRAGATLSTHLGNGVALLLPRHPNLIWAQLASDELSACFIVDGHHLPPETVKAMIRAKGLARSILVTDATAAAGAPPGRYTIGAIEIVRTPDGRVTLADGSSLAGSALTLDRALALAARYTGHTVPELWPLAAQQPAAAIGQVPRGRVTARWTPGTGRLEVLRVEPETAQ
ncbi:MAG: N-acetylglucosamine-6-phosphate deacetylase [Kiritimatiellae bacterium]|nr:N-acetylglucosamine-6-phosphate deacetylase [Kiritimatiellia bacterium]